MASGREIWNAEQIWRAELALQRAQKRLREGTPEARADYAAALAELERSCAQALRDWWEADGKNSQPG